MIRRLPSRVLLLCACAAAAPQQPRAGSIIQLADAAVQARVENVLGFTDIEHYAVYRGKDETHSIAGMTVRDVYEAGRGKTYTVLSRRGSGLVQKLGLQPLLENETRINLPANVVHSWFTSANYEMRLKPGGVQQVNGRGCYALSITPRQKAANMIDGTLWVDAKTGSIVKVEGVASKSPSVFAGTTHMMRDYREIDGYSMATHARAESSSLLFGRTVVLIDYSDYHLELRPSHGAAPAATRR